MAVVIWAADLLTKLEATGTPPAKVLCVRDAMAERWAGTKKLPADDHERHLTADEAIGVLTVKYGEDHGTVKKAKEIRDFGEITPPKPTVHPAEEIPPPPKVNPVVEAKPAERAVEEKPAEKKPEKPTTKKAEEKARGGRGRGKKAEEEAAEPSAEETPGVFDPAGEVPTVGPKPVEE